MLKYKRGGSCENRNHKTQSQNRDIKDLSRYTPACASVAGSKEGGRKPPSPAASKLLIAKELTLQDLVGIPIPEILKPVIRSSEFLRDFIKDFGKYCLRKEFGKARQIWEELDYESLKLLVPELTEASFSALKKYLLKLYYHVLNYYNRKNAIEKSLKTDKFDKLPPDKLPKQIVLKALKEKNIREWKGYKDLYYYVALILDENFKVRDARIFVTEPTLKAIRRKARKQKRFVLVSPNPVKIPREFWEEYKKAKRSTKRVRLIQKYELLKDENAFYTELIWDLDSPYSKVEEAFKDFLRDLDVEREPFLIQLEETASYRGRLRIPIAISLNAVKKARNGHTHLENIKEVLSIVAAYFQQKGINVDLTFIDRPNHQIWDKEVNPKKGKYRIREVVPAKERIKFYDLYRRIKKLQKEKKLYYLKRGNKEVNLTAYFGWREEYKKPQKTKAKVLKVPKFIAERLKDRALSNLEEDVKLYYWKKAVKSLASKYWHHRYNKVIRPAVGWAKYLDLDRYEVESYLKDVLSDRDSRKNDHDIEVAFREAPELEFKLPQGIRTLDFKAIVRETLKVLSTKGVIPRQELIKLLGHQKWLVDLIMNALEKVELVSQHFEKEGRGRPKKVFYLTEKGRLVAGNLTEETINALWREAIAVGQDFSSPDFSQYKNSPSGSLKVVVGFVSCPLVFSQYKNLSSSHSGGGRSSFLLGKQNLVSSQAPGFVSFSSVSTSSFVSSQKSDVGFFPSKPSHSDSFNFKRSSSSFVSSKGSKEILELKHYIKTDLEFLSSEEKAKVLQIARQKFGDFGTIEAIVNYLEKTGDIVKLKELSELIQKVIFFGI